MSIPAEAIVSVNGRGLASVVLPVTLVPANALLSAINGQPLTSARDGAILTSARN